MKTLLILFGAVLAWHLVILFTTPLVTDIAQKNVSSTEMREELTYANLIR